jgi:hypothetical protein
VRVQIKNRQQMLLFLALGALVFFVGDHLIFTPLVEGWTARSKHINELKRDIQNGEMLLKRESYVRNRWSEMRTNTLSPNASVAQSQMFKAFDHWAQDSRMKIGSIKPQWKHNDDVTTLECRASATGDIQSLSKFIYDAERDPLAVKVESVEITSRDNNGQQLSLVLQVSGLVLNQTQ